MNKPYRLHGRIRNGLSATPGAAKNELKAPNSIEGRDLPLTPDRSRAAFEMGSDAASWAWSTPGQRGSIQGPVDAYLVATKLFKNTGMLKSPKTGRTRVEGDTSFWEWVWWIGEGARAFNESVGLPFEAPKARQGGMAGYATDLDTFYDAYVETALWSTTDSADGQAVDFYDNYGPDDLAPEAAKEMRSDCERFIRDNERDINDGWTGLGAYSQAGHDFWLTRNGHGAGFWDRDWREPQAARLTKASEKFGEVGLYVGDDGKIYVN